MHKSIYGPVADWQTDFDHADPEYNKNAPEIWASLRAKCPIAHSERYGGVWLPLHHNLVREIAYDTEHFSNQAVIVSSDRPTVPRPVGSAPPVTSDPPFHTQARRILLPAFSGKRVALMEEDIRALCRASLDRLDLNKHYIDVAQDYAKHIPLNVIIKLIGLPAEDEELLLSFVSDIVEEVGVSNEQLAANRDRFDAYLDIHIEDHRQHPRDDLISYLLNVTIEDRPLGEQHIRGTIGLMFVAGFDTTWSIIGASLLHLATHQADLKQLVSNPSLMDLAVEEFLRAYAPVTMARLVVDDYEFHGYAFKKDDWILMNYPGANRDSDIFEDADTVHIDREENRHSAFGLGIHRCIGSNLARLELKIALEEFLRKFPMFELAEKEEVKWSKGQVRGPRNLPLKILPT